MIFMTFSRFTFCLRSISWKLIEQNKRDPIVEVVSKTSCSMTIIHSHHTDPALHSPQEVSWYSGDCGEILVLQYTSSMVYANTKGSVFRGRRQRYERKTEEKTERSTKTVRGRKGHTCAVSPVYHVFDGRV